MLFTKTLLSKITENDLLCDSNMHAKMHKDRELIIKKFCTTNQIELKYFEANASLWPR